MKNTLQLESYTAFQIRKEINLENQRDADDSLSDVLALIRQKEQRK